MRILHYSQHQNITKSTYIMELSASGGSAVGKRDKK
jgi:hypothetical protein